MNDEMLLTTPQIAAPLYLDIENKQTQTSTVQVKFHSTISTQLLIQTQALPQQGKEKHQEPQNTCVLIHNNEHSYFRSTYKRKLDRNTQSNAHI
jgi:hypothetical protein